VTRAVVLAVATILAATLLPSTGAQAAQAPKISRAFFGQTDSNPIGTSPAGWPRGTVGSIRLWDDGTAWNQIERTKNHFDFSRVDAIVATARTKHARALLVLGQTPRFWSSRPTLAGAYGRGAPAMPNRTAWKRYVARVAQRYHGTVDYQIWNEPNVAGYLRGTQQQMATLTADASRVLARFAPSGKVVGPSFPVRLAAQRTWMSRYYAQKIGKKRVASFLDVAAVNPYPAVRGADSPEAAMGLMRAAKSVLAARGVHKPVWNTEINYGLTGRGTQARRMSAARQAAYVSRTYVLNAADRVNRVFWYGWDIHRIASVELTARNNASLTPAGRAYNAVASWLVNGRLRGCSTSGGTFTCTVGITGGVRRIYWNPSRVVTIHAVKSATSRQTVTGSNARIRGGARLRVGAAPVMVRSAR
jgi:hypothetical protein